jgi:hypothetical protein
MYENKITTVFPLLSAWGIAIENGENAAAYLEKIKQMNDQHPEAVREALECSVLFQMQATSTEPVNSISHPNQRQARVQNLQFILGYDVVTYES